MGKVLIVDWVGSGLGFLGREGQSYGSGGLQKCPTSGHFLVALGPSPWPHRLITLFFFLKIYLFIRYKYPVADTVAVLRYTRSHYRWL